jgi:hypothetical protein
MNAIATATVTTKDTGEAIEGVSVLGDYHMNGGYDWMELIEAEGWAVIPSWGCDGWDLGQWPYVMVAATRTADSIGNLFGVATCTARETSAARSTGPRPGSGKRSPNRRSSTGRTDRPTARTTCPKPPPNSRPATGSPTRSTPPDQRHGRCPAHCGGAPHPTEPPERTTPHEPTDAATIPGC